MAATSIPLAAILTELEARKTQVRLANDEDTIEEYARAFTKRPASFPPVRLVSNGKGRYIIADGWHRVLAARRAKRKTIEAVVLPPMAGLAPLASALRYALRANVEHGLRLSPGDQGNKARRALAECPEVATLSDRKAAQELAVSHQTVSRARNDLVREGLLPHPDTGLTADEFLPNDYTSRQDFREAFERNPDTYHAVRTYLQRLTAERQKDWRWDAATQRVIHAGLVPDAVAAFEIEGNPIVEGKPRDWTRYEEDADEGPPARMTDADRDRIERMEARKKFEEARKRIEAYGRADLTAAARTLARYRNVPELFADLRDLVTYGGPPPEHKAGDF